MHKRQDSCFERIRWSERDRQALSKLIRCGNEIDLSQCKHLTAKCLESLLPCFDYFTKDVLDAAGVKIDGPVYFPWRKKVIHKKLKTLPKIFKRVLESLSSDILAGGLISPRAKPTYENLTAMKELVNAGKHDQIVVVYLEDRGDIQFDNGHGTIIVRGAEKLEKSGYIVNKGMIRDGKVPSLVFKDSVAKLTKETDVTSFCLYARLGTELFLKRGYELLDYAVNSKAA